MGNDSELTSKPDRGHVVRVVLAAIALVLVIVALADWNTRNGRASGKPDVHNEYTRHKLTEIAGSLQTVGAVEDAVAKLDAMLQAEPMGTVQRSNVQKAVGDLSLAVIYFRKYPDFGLTDAERERQKAQYKAECARLRDSGRELLLTAAATF